MKNIFGHKVNVVEMQSEAGAAGAFHGSLQAGALTTTYTASQGFLLMIPNMYKVAGELLPGVFHVAARALANHALNIFGDHQDVMSARATGCCLLAESNVQEVMDLGGVAHLAAIKGSLPFINFFDGFRTSHEIQKVEVMDFENFKKLVDWDAIEAFRKRALNPDHPEIRGTAENPDVYFQHTEASNKFYDAMPDIVAGYMDKISEITGRTYKPFNYYGAPDAEYVVVSMGSLSDVAKQTVEYLQSQGEKVGAINVHLYRPFSNKYLLNVLPKTVKKIALVIDRTKEPGFLGEPLYLDIVGFVTEENLNIDVIGGRTGMGSKDVFRKTSSLSSKNSRKNIRSTASRWLSTTTLPTSAFRANRKCRLTRLVLRPASSGASVPMVRSVPTRVPSRSLAITLTCMPRHISLMTPRNPAASPYRTCALAIRRSRCHTSSIMPTSSPATASPMSMASTSCGASKRAVRSCSTRLETDEELDEKLPAKLKRAIARNDVQFYIIDAVGIAQKIGLGGRINMIMQSAFFKLADVIPSTDAVKYLKESVVASYGKKGQKVVDMNNGAVDAGLSKYSMKLTIRLPGLMLSMNRLICRNIRNSSANFPSRCSNGLEGDDLPVCAYDGIEDGTMPSGTAKFEKAGPALHVPSWDAEKCIGCNQCSFVCPHAAIRPFLMTPDEAAKAPKGYQDKEIKVAPGYKYISSFPSWTAWAAAAVPMSARNRP